MITREKHICGHGFFGRVIVRPDGTKFCQLCGREVKTKGVIK